ncbi:MAG: DNA ligase D [Phycisphaerae bacterium]|nr:DNA ligase D [Saprospiraceae bacterium]
MLATLSEAFDAEDWLYEIKWDGYRAIAMINEGNVALESRNHISFNQRFYPVYDAVKAWEINAVIDGEIVVRNKAGQVNFNALQNWKSPHDGMLQYYVFDMLWLDGYDLTQMPLEKRRILLRERLPDSSNDIIHFSENFPTTASELMKAVRDLGMEGIIAKKSGSAYYPGNRSTEWLKMKIQNRQEVVIGGYILLADSPKLFSSLLIGVYDQDKFRYIGKVGTGFSVEMQKEMLRTFKPLIRETNPFQIIPVTSKPVHFRLHPREMELTYIEPELVCEVNYAEITADGLLRHPSFVAMRTDKSAKEVMQEMAIQVKKTPSSKRTNHPLMATKSTDILLPDDNENQVKTINNQELKFTNLDKYYWPKEKITKRDLINYYHQIAPYMLPYLKNRPMSLHRHPNGFNAPSFYQKDVRGKVPDWIETMAYHSEEEPDVEKEFMVCTDEASLLYMANLGCIEMNPWNCKVETPDNPDWCVLDIDPGKKNTFEQVIEVANVIYDILKTADISCVCKTSGSTGLHIYIPLKAQYTYEHSQDFARIICALAERALPETTSMERAVKSRKEKIYLDFLQNRQQATLAAPYSVRPKPNAPVSMPLSWSEVKPGLQIIDFTIKNVINLLSSRGDLFEEVLGKGIDMKAALGKLEAAWQK